MNGFEAYFVSDAGLTVEPETREDWRTWVSASRTRNWCLDDALLDWLHLWGDAKGFARDAEPDPRTDFREFLFRQGTGFEAAVVAHLAKRDEICRIPGGIASLTSVESCRESFEAMCAGVPIVYQGVLRNPEDRTFGAPDLMVRSDVLARLFPETLCAEEAEAGAPGLGLEKYHYRVVDIKFTTLDLDRHGRAGTRHLPYMAQVAVYNRALGRIQGFEPGAAYLLGRGWRKGNDEGTNCMERLAPVPTGREVRGESVESIARRAAEWIREVRTCGGDWDAREDHRRIELLPNMKNDQNYPWHAAIADLARERGELTLAWYVGVRGRAAALASGFRSWPDPGFRAAHAGVDGTRGAVLDQMLEFNRDPESPILSPEVVRTEAETWGVARDVEFYVDFETVSGLDDDFSRVPEQNGQPLIFMIGCGHIEGGEWKFECFIARDLTVESEGGIIEAWLDHMEAVRRRLAPALSDPIVFHWSPAETSALSSVMKSARGRNPRRALRWKEPRWFDFLGVMRKEPVLVRGAMGFGLKGIAKALKAEGLIETSWGDGPGDGLGAMAAAWWCAGEAKARGCDLAGIDLMQDVARYNEVDCKVMQEIVCLLRQRVAVAGRSLPQAAPTA